jgi:phage-related protein
MAYDTFTPAKKPSIGSGANHEASILEAKFEGYSQRAASGINNIQSDFPFVWSNCTSTDAAAMVSFFQGKAGYIPFWYTPPNYASAWLFICKKWSDPWASGNLYNVSATFERVFDLDA